MLCAYTLGERAASWAGRSGGRAVDSIDPVISIEARVAAAAAALSSWSR